MEYHLIYQLNCNRNHTMFFYIEIKRRTATIIIYQYRQSMISLYMEKVLPFHPISSGWISNDIYLLSEKECIYLDIKSGTFMSLGLPAYKISELLYFEAEDYFLYTTLIDPDYIDFYKKTAQSGDKKIASFHIEQGRISFVDTQASGYEKKIIKDYIEEAAELSKAGIYDVMGGHSLKVEQLSLTSKLYIDDRCVEETFGFIDRAFFFGRYVIYTISSLTFPAYIKRIPAENLSLQETEENYIGKVIRVEYDSGDIRGVHHYKVVNSEKQRGIVVMLHGGPASRYSNRFDPLIFSLAEEGYTLYLLNYTGSTGYGYEYQRALYGNAGITDCEEVLHCLRCLKSIYRGIPMYLVGDSYGGYLAILALLKTKDIVSKAYATNAFTDIRHQLLFSCARDVVQKYFKDICSSKIRDINPIDLAGEGQLQGKLLIINGLNDAYCPKEQIVQFSERSGCAVCFLPDYPHYKVDYADVKQMSDWILQDMGKGGI